MPLEIKRSVVGYDEVVEVDEITLEDVMNDERRYPPA
jgi:hypothetical protein